MGIGPAVSCVACLLWLFAAVPRANAAGLPVGGAGDCRDDIADADEYKVRSVNFSTRYAPARDLAAKTPSPGTPFTQALASELIGALHEALSRETVRDSTGATEFQILNSISPNKGTEVSVNYVTACVKPVVEADCERAPRVGSSKCVDIEVAAYAVRLNTADVWSNLLDNTRSNTPTFLSRVPGPLLAFNPTGDVAHDGRYGFSTSVDLRSNLLDLRKNLTHRVLTPTATRMNLGVHLRKSLQHDFYDAATEIALSHHFPKLIDTVSVRANGSSDHAPLGSGDYLRSLASAGMDVKLRPSSAAFSALVLGATYVRSGNRLRDSTTASPTASDENSLALRVVSDGRWLNGFSRLALWADRSSPEALAGGYHRVAARLGYARDVDVTPHQAISIEISAGGGKVWGDGPAYGLFFGGNSAGNFLYETSDSPALRSLPTGPLLRSFGSGQAAASSTSVLQGGDFYWHVNANLAFPISKWSRPLIPDITIGGIPKADANCKRVLDEDANPILDERPLGEILKSQGACARNMLALNYKMQGVPPAEAATKAAQDLRGVNSILGFLADRANLASVKPLIMVDMARIDRRGIQMRTYATAWAEEFS